MARPGWRRTIITISKVCNKWLHFVLNLGEILIHGMLSFFSFWFIFSCWSFVLRNDPHMIIFFSLSQIFFRFFSFLFSQIISSSPSFYIKANITSAASKTRRCSTCQRTTNTFFQSGNIITVHYVLRHFSRVRSCFLSYFFSYFLHPFFHSFYSVFVCVMYRTNTHTHT